MKTWIEIPDTALLLWWQWDKPEVGPNGLKIIGKIKKGYRAPYNSGGLIFWDGKNISFSVRGKQMISNQKDRVNNYISAWMKMIQ